MDNKQTNNNGLNGKLPFDFLDEGPTLKDYLPTIWRGKWIILAIVLAVFNAALLITMTQEPEYEASVSVFINTKGQKTNILGGLAVDDAKNIGNELEVLKSRMIAESVAERLMEKRYIDDNASVPVPILLFYDENENGLRWLPVGAITSRVREAVSFSPRRDSDFITITARSNNNQEAALLANTYAQVYYDRNFHLSRQQSRSVREFLENQLTAKHSNLEEAEQELKEYMQRHGVVRIDDETRRVIDQISQLEAQREATGVEIQSLSNTLVSLRRQLEEQEPTVARSISSADNPYIRMIQEQMAELEVERDLTLTQNPNAQEDERYRRMIAEIDEQLEVLRSNLRRRTDEFMQSLPTGTAADPAGFIKQLRQRILEHDIQLQGLEFKRTAINESLQRYERQFDQLPQVNMEYARLARSRTSNEKLYLMLEERYNEALITEQSEFGSVDIIDRALIPSSPVSPNLRINLLLGLMLGAGLGFAFVIGRERLYSPVRIPEDLHKNGYDTLTTVPSMNREIKKIAKNGGKFIKNGKELDPVLIMLSNPLSPPAESFRLLRTNLQFAQVDKKLKTLVITSPNPGEGKSTIVANMGISYAQAGEKVLLIDCDLRKPALADELDQLHEPGLTEVLAGVMSFNEAVQDTVVEKLDFLASGTLPANPVELLGSNKMKSLLEMLGGRYRIILLDSPPVLAASDPLVLSTAADGVVMIAASNRTKMKELDIARDSILRIGSRINGVVLNFFDYRHAYGSSYRYYRYGSYGYARDGGGKLKEIKVE